MTVITVSQLNTYIKSLLDDNRQLNNVFVVGEISNFLHYYRSGHMYFTLKDEKSQLKAVMFSSNASRLKFQLQDGMRVICRGRISVYEKDGAYQLYVDDIQPDGAGTLALAYEQLKKKLEDEGLFAQEHKKALPLFPHRIGVATSDIGAAVEDIKNITARRFPLCELVIVPTIVQGASAPEDIVKSIELLDKTADIDLIIVGRGGGSLEDLWAFNTEIVARAVYNCSKPVISAVGHETDYTICDFVADMRAPTPSAAAECAVPDSSVLNNYLDSLESYLSKFLRNKIDFEMQRLDYLANESILAKSDIFISKYTDNFDLKKTALINAIKLKTETQEAALSLTAARLNALSPLAVIERGFCVLKKNNAFIRNTKDLSTGDDIKLSLKDGSVNCTVNEVNYDG